MYSDVIFVENYAVKVTIRNAKWLAWWLAWKGNKSRRQLTAMSKMQKMWNIVVKRAKKTLGKVTLNCCVFQDAKLWNIANMQIPIGNHNIPSLMKTQKIEQDVGRIHWKIKSGNYCDDWGWSGDEKGLLRTEMDSYEAQELLMAKPTIKYYKSYKWFPRKSIVKPNRICCAIRVSACILSYYLR